MTLDASDLIMLVIGSVMSVVAWFVKRDIHRFEETAAKQSELLARHTESLSAIQVQIARVVEIGRWEPNLQRFFGEGGGQSHLWGSIKEAHEMIEQLRERDHWIANKMTVLRGKMEIAGVKLPDGDWALPEWKGTTK